MRKLLNTLYVTSENSYLGLDGENVVVYDDKKKSDVSRFTIWKELFRLDIVEQVRHLWELVQTKIFPFVI